MPPLNESNQEPVSESHFSAVNRLNIRIGAVSKLTLYETAFACPPGRITADQLMCAEAAGQNKQHSANPLMALGAGLAHNFKELVVGSDASVNGHVLRYIQLLLPHILIKRPHPAVGAGSRLIMYIGL